MTTGRELDWLSDEQLAQLLWQINAVLWERHGAEEGEQPEGLETLVSACEEITDLVT